jgi:hypothetical protein
MSAIKYIAIGVGTILGGRYLYTLHRAKNQITTTVRGQKESINAQGVVLQLKYNIKNPTKARIRITPPLVKLSFNTILLASSTMKGVEIPPEVKDAENRIIIAPHSETGEITTRIIIPWLSVVRISSELMRKLQSTDPKEKLQVEIATIAQVYLPTGSYPLDDKTTIEI